MSELHGLTVDELAILERLGALNYLDNFDPSDHPTIYKLKDLGLLEDRFPCLSTNEIGARTVYYKRALDVRHGRSRFDVLQCRFEGHDWCYSHEPPWKKDLARIPTASYCTRCGVYVEYVGDKYDWRNGVVPRNEDGDVIRLHSDYSEWEWK